MLIYFLFREDGGDNANYHNIVSYQTTPMTHIQFWPHDLSFG